MVSPRWSGVRWAALALAVAGCFGCSAPEVRMTNALHVDPIEADPAAAGVRWAGRWQTNWGQLELFVDGKQIRGAFRYLSQGAERVGLLIGQTEGNVLTFTWVEQKGTDKGRGKFFAAPDSAKFSGMYGYADSDSDGGEWCGVRSDAP